MLAPLASGPWMTQACPVPTAQWSLRMPVASHSSSGLPGATTPLLQAPGGQGSEEGFQPRLGAVAGLGGEAEAGLSRTVPPPELPEASPLADLAGPAPS